MPSTRIVCEPSPRDADAHAAQELAELDDVRLAGGVSNLRHARRRGRGEQRGFRSGHRRFVEIDRRRLQAVRRPRDDGRSPGCTRAPIAISASRCVLMRAPRRKIAARRRDDGAAAARQQRPHQQHRAAQASDQRAVGLVLGDVGAADAQRGAADAFDLGAEIEQQPRHHLDVGDARHVGERAPLVGQQARRHQRQRRVLVAFDVDAAFDAAAAFNHQCGHIEFQL